MRKKMNFNAMPDHLSKGTLELGKQLAEQERKHQQATATERKDKSVYPEDTYLTINQACEYLHVSRMTIWRWSKDGILKPKKIGCKTLYARADIDDYLNNQNSCSHE